MANTQPTGDNSNRTNTVVTVEVAVDAGVIYTGLLRHWLRFTFRVEVRTMSSTACKIHFHLTYLFRQVRPTGVPAKPPPSEIHYNTLHIICMCK